MTPTFAEFDEVIADFYWPDVRSGDPERLRIAKTRAIMAAKYWGERGLPGARSILFNLAGRLEVLLAAFPVQEGNLGPDREQRLISAASCFALAGNWMDVAELLRIIGPAATQDRELVEVWANLRSTAEGNGEAISELARLLSADHLDEAADVALRLLGEAPPRLLLWPIARASMKAGDVEGAARWCRLLAIAEPFELTYQLSAAQYDRPDERARHASFIGSAFQGNSYAQAFAAYQLMRLGHPQDGLPFAEAGWALASTSPNEPTPAQYAFTAMTISAVLREVGRLGDATALLEDACRYSVDPELRTYLAMLLVTINRVQDAIGHLEVAVAKSKRTHWADLLLGTLHLEAERPEVAIPLLRDAMTRAKEGTRARTIAQNNLGIALAVAGRSDEAIGVLQGVVDSDEISEMASRNRAAIESNIGGKLQIIGSKQLAAASQEEVMFAKMLTSRPAPAILAA